MLEEPHHPDVVERRVLERERQRVGFQQCRLDSASLEVNTRELELLRLDVDAEQSHARELLPEHRQHRSHAAADLEQSRPGLELACRRESAGAASARPVDEALLLLRRVAMDIPAHGNHAACFDLVSSSVEDRSDIAERMIDTNGVQLCTETFGSRADPPVLLVMGLGASMLWWEEGFCRMLAARGRFVIRYDHRDTGRSVTYEPGRPGYTGADLVTDAVGVLDAYGIPAAHVVGVSAGGAIAQLLALDYADRVLSLVLISTSPATPGDRDLPSPTETFSRFATRRSWTGRTPRRRSSTWSTTPACSPAVSVRSTRRATATSSAATSSARTTSRPAEPRRHRRRRALGHTRVRDRRADARRPRHRRPAVPDRARPDAGRGDPRRTLLALEGAGHGVDQADWDDDRGRDRRTHRFDIRVKTRSLLVPNAAGRARRVCASNATEIGISSRRHG